MFLWRQRHTDPREPGGHRLPALPTNSSTRARIPRRIFTSSRSSAARRRAAAAAAAGAADCRSEEPQGRERAPRAWAWSASISSCVAAVKRGADQTWPRAGRHAQFIRGDLHSCGEIERREIIVGRNVAAMPQRASSSLDSPDISVPNTSATSPPSACGDRGPCRIAQRQHAPAYSRGRADRPMASDASGKRVVERCDNSAQHRARPSRRQPAPPRPGRESARARPAPAATGPSSAWRAPRRRCCRDAGCAQGRFGCARARWPG